MASTTNAAPKRDAGSDTEHPDAPAQKLVKAKGHTKAAIRSSSTEQTPDVTSTTKEDVNLLPKVANVGDPARHTMESTEDTTLLKASAKGKAQATDHAPNDSTGTEDAASRLKEHIGDLFEAPDNSVLIHACNTLGSWGGGIAKEFRKRYPKAFEKYERHCLSVHHPTTNPVPRGTCLLIPPVEREPGAPKHWIGCLFTSAKHGRSKDPPDMILQNTAPAFGDLLDQLSRQPTITNVRMCQINSVLFGVPWKATKKVLESVLATNGGYEQIHIYSLPTAPTSGSGRVGSRNPANGSLDAQLVPKRQPASKGGLTSKGQTTLRSFIRKQ